MKSILCCIVAGACLHTILPAQPLRISDFRIPTTFFERFTGNFYGSAGHLNQDQGPFSSTSQSQMFSVIPIYQMLASSEESEHSIYVSLGGSLSSSKYARTEDGAGRQTKRTAKSERSDIRAAWSGSVSSDPGKWYLFGSFDGRGSYSFFSSSQEFHDTVLATSVRESDRTRDYQVRAGIGLGFGKMRDGLPVFAVLRILEKLREDGVLLREPERNEVLALVHVYARTEEYKGKHERHTKFLMGDLFESMEAMGLVERSGLAAYAVLRTVEVLAEQIEPRRFGWRIQVGMEHYSSQYEYIASSVSNRDKRRSDNLMVTGEIGHDLSLEAHTLLRVDTRFGLFARQDRFMELTVRWIFSYEFGERIQGRMEASYLRTNDWTRSGSLFNPETKNTDVNASLLLLFFLEDRINFSARTSYTLDERNRILTSGMRFRELARAMDVSFGLNYRFF